jgi:triosephosphate isomerase (TIM)
VAAQRTPLMAGNWKMNLNHLEAIRLVQDLAFRLTDADLAAVEVAVLTPFTDVRSVQTLVDADHLGLRYGAQDVSEHDSGAFTGDVSAPMLAKLGCRYVVVGHSERREHHGESDALVNAKARAALRHGITPIVCVGEPLTVRQAGGHLEHVHAQIAGSLAGLSEEQVAGLVVAYEPVWAIGTGLTPTPADVAQAHEFIRNRLVERHGPVGNAVRVLYGGSVKPSNAQELMAVAHVDGALVGGASLKAEDFLGICGVYR